MRGSLEGSRGDRYLVPATRRTKITITALHHYEGHNLGLPTGWVTDADELTHNQQITALGNGVLPLQAGTALNLLRGPFATQPRSSFWNNLTHCPASRGNAD